jgi:predicted DsbA family dithiol-disulfide isomerase
MDSVSPAESFLPLEAIVSSSSIDVYIDFLCPYAHAGSSWLREVRSQLNGELEINWKFFPLEQVNSKEGPEWNVWDQSVDHRTRGWEGFRAAVAAINQGDQAFEAFSAAWFNALHETPVGVKRPTVFEVAAQVGLDTEKFARDFDDRSLWARVGEDYRHGREELGVFGTPTIVFEDGPSAYIQMRPPAPANEALKVWDEFKTTVVGRPYIREIKRPVPPT